MILTIGFIIVWDIFDRGEYYSVHIPEKEFAEFYGHRDWNEQQKAYKKNFGKDEWKFPREEVAKAKIYRNAFLTSRITSETLSENETEEIITFFNNPENFSFRETTWAVTESDYIFRFFDQNDTQIGKIWLSTDDTWMTKSRPFSPNMKYGSLSETGAKEILELIKRIQRK
ncbi:hypothetical protein BST93_10265 [Nonlabens tegetincola]|nr:hypothetical protein BST93_10265 [Nonlabens tegetincola]